MYNHFISEGSIAGGTAGVVVETSLYPIDTIKTRLQKNMLQVKMLHVNINVPHMQTHGSFCFLFLKHNFTMSLEIFSLCFFTIFEPRADWFGAEDDLFSYILIHL
ncbi:hypothetical protein ACJX0J_035859, partial [Zea mays]